MKNLFAVAFLGALISSGCMSDSNFNHDFSGEFLENDESVTWVKYMGFKDGLHFFHCDYNQGTVVYKIKMKMSSDETVSYTEDPKVWKSYQKYGSFWKSIKEHDEKNAGDLPKEAIEFHGFPDFRR